MRKMLLILTLLPTIALAFPFGHDEGPCGDQPPLGHHGFEGGREHLPRFLKDLNLSDDQQTAIKNLLKSGGSDLEAKHEAAQKIHQEIQSLSFSADYTEAKAQAIIDKGIALRNELDLKKTSLDNAIYKLLNAEQQQKLKANLAQGDGGFFHKH
jgi:Spy/CpxP family protein refolding chaperone